MGRSGRGRKAGALVVLGFALAVPLAAQQWSVASFTTDDGLAGSQVWSLLQDRRGYLWITTSAGVSRYDGHGFVSFSTADGLHNQVVRTVVEDLQGQLWFGTHDGVSRFDGKSFVALTSERGLGRGVVWASVRDRWGHLWFGTSEGGVSLAVGDRFRTYTTADGLAQDYVYALHADSAGFLWVGHRGAGVTRCRLSPAGGLGECRGFTRVDGLGHDEVRAVVEDSTGALYFGTRGGGVSRFDGERFRTFTVADGLADDDVYALMVNQRGELVVGTREGVSFCSLPDLGSCRGLGTGNGLRDSSVHALLEDRDHVLWIGLNNGLNQLLTESLQTYTVREGLPHAKVYSVVPGPAGEVWVGTSGGLARIGPDRRVDGSSPVEVWTERSGLPASWVSKLLLDHRGRLWVGTPQGLCRFEPTRGCREVITVDEGLMSNQVLALAEDEPGALWVGTPEGLNRVWPDGGRPRVERMGGADGLAGSAASCLAVDPHGRLWVGSTGQGLTVVDRGEAFVLTIDDGLPSNAIAALLAARSGDVWVGTNGGGVAVLPSGSDPRRPTFEILGPEDGVPGQAAALGEDPSGRVWVGSGSGVLLLDRERAGAGWSPVVARFDRHTGLPSSEVHDVAVDRHGHLWIGLSEGLTRYQPSREEPPSAAPVVTLERVTSGQGRLLRFPFSEATDPVRGEAVWADSGSLVLPPSDTSVRIDYRVLSFRPRGTRVQVRLEGLDRGWAEGTGAPFRDYTNLDPGRYRFQVRAAGIDGRWGPQAEVAFRVLPAFWQTWWFVLASGVAVVLVLVAAYRWRTDRIRTRTRELEAVVAERTDDLRRYARALEHHAHALRQANLRISAAERAKSEFLASMSHELRTPLNSIIGFADVLLERSPDPERQRRFLTHIRSGGAHLLQLINNLLDLSKIEAGRMGVDLEPVHLGAALDEMCAVMQGYSARREVTIRTRVLASPPEVLVDLAKLRQILLNLLSNAVKFSPPGGTVELGAVGVEKADSALGVDSYELWVSDNGPGIRPDDQAAIFEAFHQARGGARRAGTGLGLAIVRRFVSMLGGRVTVESTPGQGATFRVVLPVEARVAARATADGESGEVIAADLAQQTVLVLESDRAAFAAVAAELEGRGALAVRATGAEDAARVAAEVGPVALVIDLRLPSLDGWSALATVAHQTAGGVPPVVLTCQSGTGAGDLVVGADHCLLHPLAAGELMAVVRRRCSGPHGQGPLLAVGNAALGTEARSALTGAGVEVVEVAGVEDLAAGVAASHPCLVVVDLMADEPNGFAVLERLARDPALEGVPVLAVVAMASGRGERAALSERLHAASASTGGPLSPTRIVRLLAARHAVPTTAAVGGVEGT